MHYFSKFSIEMSDALAANSFYLGEIELKIAREQLRIPTDIAIDKFFENLLAYVEQHL